MKYIDAEKLKSQIREWYNTYKLGQHSPYRNGKAEALRETIELIDSLQQDQLIGEEYTIEVGKHTHTLRVGSQSDIDNLIHQEKQEQPEIDIKRELYSYICSDEYMNTREDGSVLIARHFYKLGLKARKGDCK